MLKPKTWLEVLDGHWEKKRGIEERGTYQRLMPLTYAICFPALAEGITAISDPIANLSRSPGAPVFMNLLGRGSLEFKVSVNSRNNKLPD